MKTFVSVLLGILVGLLVGLLIGGMIWLSASNPPGDAVVLLSSPTPKTYAVYVSGAVNSPGLYYLPEGSRVNDAILAAGGFADNAQQDMVNLAAMVEDEVQINVPGLGGTQTQINLGRVNINTATVEELDALPGIGETAAAAIVEYRAEHGPFEHIQDIQDVPGIGPATYEQIDSLITVGS